MDDRQTPDRAGRARIVPPPEPAWPTVDRRRTAPTSYRAVGFELLSTRMRMVTAVVVIAPLALIIFLVR